MWLSDFSILFTGQQTNLHIAASLAGVLSVGGAVLFWRRNREKSGYKPMDFHSRLRRSFRVRR